MSLIFFCTAAETVSKGLEKGTEKAGALMHRTSNLIKEKVTPQEEPTKIHPRVQEHMHHAKQASVVAVTVSEYVSRYIDVLHRNYDSN